MLEGDWVPLENLTPRQQGLAVLCLNVTWGVPAAGLHDDGQVANRRCSSRLEAATSLRYEPVVEGGVHATAEARRGHGVAIAERGARWASRMGRMVNSDIPCGLIGYSCES